MSAAPESRAEWIEWAVDLLRRYAPDPVVERDDDLDEEIDAIERMDAERFFEDEQAYHGDRRR